MAAYKIYFRESVEKDFSTIPKKDIEKILHRIEVLTENPRPPGCESRLARRGIVSVKVDTELYIQFKMM